MEHAAFEPPITLVDTIVMTVQPQLLSFEPLKCSRKEPTTYSGKKLVVKRHRPRVVTP